MAKPFKSDVSHQHQRPKLDSFAAKNADIEANTKYESGLIPLVWLGIPFVLVLIYGFFS